MTDKLASLFLRLGASGEGEAELKEEFGAEIERLTNAVGEWSRQVGGLPQGRHPGRLINDCDEAISQAVRAAESADYAAAFDAVRRAHAALARVRGAWESNLAYEDARAAHEAVEALHSSRRLGPLLTLRDLSLLLDQTLRLLERGEYGQAELLGHACRHRGEMLCGRQGGDVAPADLHAQLSGLSALCDEAARFLPHGREDWADKVALGTVETLLRGRHYALAQRLLNDLEVELTPHRTFLDTYRQLRPAAGGDGTPPREGDADLLEIIAAQSWSAATSYLLDTALGGMGEGLAQAASRAAAIRQQVAALDPGRRAAR